MKSTNRSNRVELIYLPNSNLQYVKIGQNMARKLQMLATWGIFVKKVANFGNPVHLFANKLSKLATRDIFFYKKIAKFGNLGHFFAKNWHVCQNLSI